MSYRINQWVTVKLINFEIVKLDAAVQGVAPTVHQVTNFLVCGMKLGSFRRMLLLLLWEQQLVKDVDIKKERKRLIVGSGIVG